MSRRPATDFLAPKATCQVMTISGGLWAIATVPGEAVTLVPLGLRLP